MSTDSAVWRLPDPRTARLPLAIAAASLVAVLALTACGKGDTAPANAPAEAAAPQQEGARLRFPANHPQLAILPLTPARANDVLVAELPARLIWNEERTQRVYPSFAGRVTSIQADLGQTVKAGSTLATLASPDFGQAQADAAKARADAELSRQALRRQKELLDAGIVAQKDYEQSQADAARTSAELSRAQARTALYGGGNAVNQQLTLKANMAGVVVERNMNPGQELRPELAGPGVPPLFVVTDPRSLWVLIDAKEADIAALQRGAEFNLHVPAYPNEKFRGRVMASADAIDPTTRTIKVRGLLDNSDRRLKAEMLATALVEEPHARGVLIPASAVMLEDGKHVVCIQVAPGTFERRVVTIGHTSTTEALVTSGLQAGDQVVAQNALLLARLFDKDMEAGQGKKAEAEGRKP